MNICKIKNKEEEKEEEKQKEIKNYGKEMRNKGN